MDNWSIMSRYRAKQRPRWTLLRRTFMHLRTLEQAFSRKPSTDTFTSMLRILHILLLALLVCAPIQAQTNRNIRKLQSQQKTLKKDIADKEQMLRSTRKDVNSQLANLRVINAQIEGQQKYVDGIHSELTTLSGSIQGLEQQLRLLENDLNECKRKYQRAVTYVFRNRMMVSKWQFILSARNFRQMYRRMRYVTEFSRYQRAQARIIHQKEVEVQTKRAELMGVKVEKDKLLAEGQAETRKLQGQQTERQQVVDELNKKQSELQASLAQQRKKAAALDARIDKLIQEEIAAAERRRKAEAERKRKAELARQAQLKKQREQAAAAAAAKKAREKAEADRRKAEASAKAKGKSAGKQTASASTRKAASKSRPAQAAPEVERTATPSFNEADNADRALSSNFAANRGRLPIPITGSYAITTHYGSYNVEGLRGVQLDSKGINITGRPGAQARAIFRGEVTSVFPFGGTYNVIVRHGSYLSVYCNLSSIAVRRGQEVSARQTLGTVATDASGNCTLHFQLRKETSKLNPEAWLGR